VTGLAAHLQVYTPQLLASQTLDAAPRRVGESTVISMGIARRFDRRLRWCTRDREIWVPDAVPDQATPSTQQEQDAGHPLPPPPPPPVPRTVVRLIPPTPEFMGETLHLLREMHSFQRWMMTSYCRFAMEQGVLLDPMPQSVPYVAHPGPADEDDQGQGGAADQGQGGAADQGQGGPDA
jgi:hypothetical protein